MKTQVFREGTIAGLCGLVLGCACAFGCATLSEVTPEARAVAYEREAAAAHAACKAYNFDVNAGLTRPVPAMAELCK